MLHDDLLELQQLLKSAKYLHDKDTDGVSRNLPLAFARDKVDAMISEELARMEEEGDIAQCSGCGGYSAYAWSDVSTFLQPDDSTYNRPDREQRHLIAHIGVADCFGFECGHCGARNTDKDSPTLAECYTHVNYEEEPND